MTAVLYLLFAILITILCYVIFLLGRIFECSITIREYGDMMEALQMELDNLDKMIAELEGGDTDA